MFNNKIIYLYLWLIIFEIFRSDDGDYEPLEIDVYSVPRSLAEDDEEAI